MQRANNNKYKIKQLQVGILDNGRKGTAYVCSINTTRTLPTGPENAIDEAYYNSNGFPFISGLFSQGGFKQAQCVIVALSEDNLAEEISAIIDSISVLKNQPMEYHRLFLIPLGKDFFFGEISEELLNQVNADIRQFNMTYYDFNSDPKPTLHHLGKTVLPNAERYCDFKDGAMFTADEEKNLIDQRTKSMMAVSHGRPPASRFLLNMVELIPHTPIQSVAYRKQTQKMVELPIAEFERKIARARGIPTFRFSSQVMISQVLADFNDDLLPPPAWSFSFGKPLTLSIQHDYHYLSNPKHPFLSKDRCTRVSDIKAFMYPTPPVYFSFIGGVNSYGVFAATDLKAEAVIDVYAGVFSDHHDHPNANNYCYRPVIPGFQYSYCQGVYALETGNTTTFINSAAHEDASNRKSPSLKANVAAELCLYKKMPLIVYRTLKSIPKDTQLVINYEDMVHDLCPRHFTFFGNGSSITVNAKTTEYAKEDINTGLVEYKKGNYQQAKIAFKTARHLLHACMTQLSKTEAEKVRLVFASACEYLANSYEKLDHKPKAIQYFAEAIRAREAVLKLTDDIRTRVTLLRNKIDKLQGAPLALKK